MRKILYILIVAGIALILAGGVWIVGQYLHPTSTSNQTPYTNPSSYSNGNNSVTGSGSNPSPTKPSGATMTVLLASGKTLLVKDFINNHETVPDTVNPGYYYLAGSIGYCLGNGSCPSGYITDDFSITYHNADGHFNIILLTEPLAEARSEAELFLLDRLGIPQAQLCNTNYWIGTTVQIDEAYGGKNLGFGFCPGATQL